MHTNAQDCDEVWHEGEAARLWLREHCGAINTKWKNVDLQWVGQTRQVFQDETGNPKNYICPAHYILSYYRKRFRFFGGSEKNVITFSEQDIRSVLFRREAAWTFWDAHYNLHIGLRNGFIDITYSPPFSGVTPIANARHSENVLVRYDLHYKPLLP